MSDPGEPPTPVQGSLFPGDVEVWSASLSALRDLDVARARVLLERVRTGNPRLVNLAVIEEALRVLEMRPKPGPCRLADLALAVGEEYRAGRLSEAAAGFVDETVARYWKRSGSAGPFLDEAARVHRGVLDLVLGDAMTARRHLGASLEGGFDHRADLWGYMGDACLALERTAEANACYVRGLLLSATDVDLMRIRLRRLAELHAELCRAYPEGCARELLLVHAWLEGTLQIRSHNRWLDRHLPQLMDRAGAGPGSPPEDRFRRFALLLFLDRSSPPRDVDLARREEMATLEEGLFARYMHECRAREPAG